MKITSISNSLNREHLFTYYTSNDTNKNLFKVASSVVKESDGSTLLDQQNISTFEETTVPISIQLQDITSSNKKIYDLINSNITRALTENYIIDVSLDKISDLMNDLEDVAEAATASTLTTAERDEMTQVATEIVEKIDGFYNNIAYNDIKLLQGGSKTFKITPDGSEITTYYASGGSAFFGVDSIDFTDVASSQTSLTNVEEGIYKLESEQLSNADEKPVLESAYNANQYNQTVSNVNIENILNAESAQNIIDSTKLELHSDMNLLLTTQASKVDSNAIKKVLKSIETLTYESNATDENIKEVKKTKVDESEPEVTNQSTE